MDFFVSKMLHNNLELYEKFQIILFDHHNLEMQKFHFVNQDT